MYRTLIVLLVSALVASGALFIGKRAYDVYCIVPSTAGVTMEVKSTLTQTVASASVGYTVALHNASTVHFDGASLAVEVRNASTSQIVDRFVVHNVVLAANANGMTDFIWHAPVWLVPATYNVHVSFVPQGIGYGDAYTTTLYPQAQSNIRVVAGAAPTVTFSGEMTQVMSAQTSPRESVAVQITNLSALPYRGTILWRMWSKETHVTGEPIVIDAQEVELLPHGTTTLGYVVAHEQGVPTYVEAELVREEVPQAYVGTWVSKNANEQVTTTCSARSLFRALINAL